MPFEVFRRHQKKMLAVLAIMAMVAFTLDFSLFRGRGASGGTNDTVVATLYGKAVRRSDLALMAEQRSRANRFVGQLFNLPNYPIFGGMDTRSLVDALILEHEADRLGMPLNTKLAKDWLRSQTNNQITSEMFDQVYRSNNFSEQVTEEGLLSDLANQIRIRTVRELPGTPQVTPLDVYRAYRDQYEMVSADAAAFPVADYVKQVASPTESEVSAYFEKYKDVLPDSSRDTPGFKIPRRVGLEYLIVDGAAVAKAIKAKLKESELREAFERRRKDLPIDPPQLPIDLFEGDPQAKLTPKLNDDFYEVQSYLETLVADERAREEIDKALGDIKDQVMLPFSDKYAAASEDKKDGKANVSLPDPGDLLKSAAKGTIEGAKLEYEKTPKPVDHEGLDHLPFISGAKVGISYSGDGRTFEQALLDPRAPLFDPIELADALGRRYLAWKTADEPARVPALSEVRDDVVLAWKMEKARPLAEKAANALAEEARKKGGDLKAVAGKITLITTDPVTKMQPSPSFNQFQFNPARPSDIPKLPEAGEALRDALFNLGDKSVAVAPDGPMTHYYVLAMNRKTPADPARLLDTFGPYMSLKTEVRTEEMVRRDESWMSSLRKEAGLPADWKPSDENRGEGAASDEG